MKKLLALMVISGLVLGFTGCGPAKPTSKPNTGGKPGVSGQSLPSGDDKKPMDPPKPPGDDKKPMDPPKPPGDDKKPTDPPKPPGDDKKPTDPPKPPTGTDKKPTDPPKNP